MFSLSALNNNIFSQNDPALFIFSKYNKLGNSKYLKKKSYQIQIILLWKAN